MKKQILMIIAACAMQSACAMEQKPAVDQAKKKPLDAILQLAAEGNIDGTCEGYGKSALVMATELDMADLVQMLLKHGAKAGGEEAYVIAAARNNAVIQSFLVMYGAASDWKKTYQGKTAVSKQKFETVENSNNV